MTPHQTPLIEQGATEVLQDSVDGCRLTAPVGWQHAESAQIVRQWIEAFRRNLGRVALTSLGKATAQLQL